MALARIIAPFLTLALSLAGAGAVAQPPAAPQAEAGPGAGEQDSTGGTEPGQADAPAPARGDASPFDYRPSEQISEDLSVSFPVDI